MDPTTYQTAETFHVTLIFFLEESRYRDSDLDNLAKPVLDTIFLIDRPQTKDTTITGALVWRNDGAVTRLTLEKRPVSDLKDVGVDVTIEWP